MEGLEGLLQGTFEGDITIRKNLQLESLLAFSGLETIRGNVTVEDNMRLLDLDGFENIHTITGHLIIDGNAELIAIEMLRGLTHASRAS